MPTLGITDINYSIVAGTVLIKIEVMNYTSTGLSFRVVVNTQNNLVFVALTYMALDASFTPAFSMNDYFPVKM